ncbi:MAG: septum formation initiator family protein [Patescibacteria group bacterium]
MNIKKLLISKPILILEVLVLGYFAFNVGQEMFKKHNIETEISHLENEINKLEKDKNDLNDLLSYVQTDAFVEQEAREKLNLAKAGESLVLLPESDATPEGEAQTENSATPLAAANQDASAKKSNLAKWWQYFFEHERLALE